jgi:hypothetical protein
MSSAPHFAMSPALGFSLDFTMPSAPPGAKSGPFAPPSAQLHSFAFPMTNARAANNGADAIARLRHLLSEFDERDDWGALLEMGDIYKNGDYPRWLPDEDSALRLFRSCAGGPDARAASLGAQRFIETRMEPVAREDRAGGRIPTRFADDGVRASLEKARRAPSTAWQKPSAAPKRINPITNDADDLWAAIARHSGVGEAILRGVRVGAPPPDVRTPSDARVVAAAREAADVATRAAEAVLANAVTQYDKGRSNGQNVHDHSMTAAVRDNIRAIVDAAGPESTARAAVEASLEQVTDAVLSSDHGEAVKTDALKAIDDMRRADGASRIPHSVFKVSAPQALSAVWTIIRGRADGERRRDMAGALTSQLASVIEKGVPVCLTGKISRIAGALDGQGDALGDALRDSLRTAKPMWAVKEELAGLAAKARDDAEADPAAHPDGGASLFESRALAEYVGQLGMSEKIVGPMIADVRQGF